MFLQTSSEKYLITSITWSITKKERNEFFPSVLQKCENLLKNRQDTLKKKLSLQNGSTDVPCHIPQATAAFPPDCSINQVLAFLHKLHPYFICYFSASYKNKCLARLWNIHCAALHGKGQLWGEENEKEEKKRRWTSSRWWHNHRFFTFAPFHSAN